MVQSPSKSTEQIITRTDKFINSFYEVLMAKSADVVNDYIQGCIDPLTFPFSNVDEMSSYYFEQIDQIDSPTNFNMNEALIDTYGIITKQMLVDFFVDKLLSNPRALIVGYEKV